MGDRIARMAWRIMHPYHRRPRSTFATTIAAVIALHFCLLAARRGAAEELTLLDPVQLGWDLPRRRSTATS